MNNKEIGERIKYLRKKLGISQAVFAQKSGISIGGVCELEKGKMGLQSKTIIRICKAFNVSPEWLLLGEENKRELPTIDAKQETKKLLPIPIINEVPASYPAYPILDDFIRDYIYLPNLPTGCFGLIVRGDSMEPELHENDIVIVNPKILPENLKNNDIGVFRVNNEPTIKVFIKLDQGCILQPRNPKYTPIVISDETQCELVGKVIYKIIKCK